MALLCLFLSNKAIAQMQVSTSTLSGYESNILRFPDQLLVEGELLGASELFKSSYFQDIKASIKYTKESRKSIFKISTKAQKRFYFTEAESNRLLADFKVNYKRYFSRYTSWENSAQYYIKDQNGLDADENEIGGSFGYKLFNMDSKLNFSLFKSNRSFISAHYGEKKFNPTETRNVSYSKYGLKAGFKNIKWRNHLLRSYGFTAAFIQRQYAIESSNEDDGFTSENRTWNYINTRAFFKIELTKEWTLYPSLTYEKRLDQSDTRFGYNEITPKIYLSYSGEKISASVSGSYTQRNFTDLVVNESDLLNYKYFRLKLNTSYKISNSWSIISQAYIVNRETNNASLNTVAFRSYNNYYVGFGLQFNF